MKPQPKANPKAGPRAVERKVLQMAPPGAPSLTQEAITARNRLLVI